jgi:hypothetical protein
MERRVIYNEQCQPFHQQNSDEEEEDEEGYGRSRRKQGASVDEFLRGSELGRPVRHRIKRIEHTRISVIFCRCCISWYDFTPFVCACVYVFACVCLCVCVCVSGPLQPQ